jgi:serine/threonine protein kinase
VKTKRDVVIRWINKVLDSEMNTEYWITCHNKEHQKGLIKDFKKEIKILQEINAKDAMQVQLTPTYKKQGNNIILYLVLKKIPGTPFIGFKREPDGSTSKIDLREEEESGN